MDIHNHFVVAVSGTMPTGEMRTALEKYLSELGTTDEVRIRVTIDEFKQVKFSFQLTENEYDDNVENGKKFVEAIKGANLLLLNERVLPNSVHQIVYGCTEKMMHEAAKNIEDTVLEKNGERSVFCGIAAACYDTEGKFVRFTNIV